jgi:hypothetical protein
MPIKAIFGDAFDLDKAPGVSAVFSRVGCARHQLILEMTHH